MEGNEMRNEIGTRHVKLLNLLSNFIGTLYHFSWSSQEDQEIWKKKIEESSTTLLLFVEETKKCVE